MDGLKVVPHGMYMTLRSPIFYTNGGVPLSQPSWQTYNVYRSRPTEDAMTVIYLQKSQISVLQVVIQRVLFD